jgi:hypothetical protein
MSQDGMVGLCNMQRSDELAMDNIRDDAAGITG